MREKTITVTLEKAREWYNSDTASFLPKEQMKKMIVLRVICTGIAASAYGCCFNACL